MRELRNVTNRISLNASQNEVTINDVRQVLLGNPKIRWTPASEENDFPERRTARTGTGLEIQERSCILNALRSNNCNITDSARYLNISRATLYNKIRKHKILLKKGVLGVFEGRYATDGQRLETENL